MKTRVGPIPLVTFLSWNGQFLPDDSGQHAGLLKRRAMFWRPVAVGGICLAYEQDSLTLTGSVQLTSAVICAGAGVCGEYVICIMHRQYTSCQDTTPCISAESQRLQLRPTWTSLPDLHQSTGDKTNLHGSPAVLIRKLLALTTGTTDEYVR